MRYVGKLAGVAVWLFSVFEVVMRISIGIQDMRIFGRYGMNTLYSPGLIVMSGTANSLSRTTDTPILRLKRRNRK